MFEKIAAAPADPILGLTDEFKNDPRAEKKSTLVLVFTKTKRVKLQF